MQLLELNLTNWGPFFGEHTIPLEVDSSAPVVLFRGENMRGKTSLLRAIVWGLYAEIREQDGRTPLPVERMVNLDALEAGEAPFGVSLRFSHRGSEYTLHRSGKASGDTADKVTARDLSVDLIPSGGHPYPSQSIPEVVDGILSHEISDFFLFDGEMLNRFEERLRAESTAAQGFVREQVERALGLPFMSQLSGDLETIQGAITASMDQVLRKAKKHNALSERYGDKKDELSGVETDLRQLRDKQSEVDVNVSELDAQLAKIEEIKDLYYERKNLEGQIAGSEDTMRDYRAALAELAESQWWLPMAESLQAEHAEAENEITTAEVSYGESVRLGLQIDQLREHLASGVCPTCKQAVVHGDEDEVREQLATLESQLADLPSADMDALRARRDRLRRFATGSATMQRVFEQQQDLKRERLRNDKNKQKVRRISEQISSNAVDIESLERNLRDAKLLQARLGDAIALQDERRLTLKQEVATLSSQIADQPEVDETERRLQKTVAEAQEIVSQSYDDFRSSMKERINQSATHLFKRLTTEKEYSGIHISDDYTLKVVDHEGRSLSGQISAGANQIMTTAFIGALASCSVDEAPMVMDTPFGRLDTGHRSAILEWVATFDSQVILFVQSGEYDPERDAHLLGNKIGREFTIDRLSPTRSEVSQA